jgi:hypothetical protein
MSFATFIKSARTTIHTGLRFLPVFLAFTILTIGLTTCNIPFILLFIGMFAFLPIGIFVLQKITQYMSIPLFQSTESLFPIVEAAAKNAENTTEHISYGYSILIFLFTYLIANAVHLIQTNEEPEIRGRGTMSVLIVITVLIMYFISHILNKPAETTTGLVLLTTLSVLFGIGWFYAMSGCGKAVADIYGVENNKYVTEASARVCAISG